MRNSLILISIIIVFSLVGCNNKASEVSEATEVMVETPAAESVASDTKPHESITEEPIKEVRESMPIEEKVDLSSVNYQDFMDGNIFLEDEYAKALGYTTLEDEDGYNDYLLDKDGTHYYVNVYKDGLNIFFQQGNVSYGMNNKDMHEAEKSMKSSSGSKTFSVSETWIQGVAKTLQYVATTNPANVNLDSINATLYSSCTLYDGSICFDNEGRLVTDSTVSLDQELLWVKNK